MTLFCSDQGHLDVISSLDQHRTPSGYYLAEVADVFLDYNSWPRLEVAFLVRSLKEHKGRHLGIRLSFTAREGSVDDQGLVVITGRDARHISLGEGAGATFWQQFIGKRVVLQLKWDEDPMRALPDVVAVRAVKTSTPSIQEDNHGNA